VISTTKTTTMSDDDITRTRIIISPLKRTKTMPSRARPLLHLNSTRRHSIHSMLSASRSRHRTTALAKWHEAAMPADVVQNVSIPISIWAAESSLGWKEADILIEGKWYESVMLETIKWHGQKLSLSDNGTNVMASITPPSITAPTASPFATLWNNRTTTTITTIVPPKLNTDAMMEWKEWSGVNVSMDQVFTLHPLHSLHSLCNARSTLSFDPFAIKIFERSTRETDTAPLKLPNITSTMPSISVSNFPSSITVLNSTNWKEDLQYSQYLRGLWQLHEHGKQPTKKKQQKLKQYKQQSIYRRKTQQQRSRYADAAFQFCGQQEDYERVSGAMDHKHEFDRIVREYIDTGKHRRSKQSRYRPGSPLPEMNCKISHTRQQGKKTEKQRRRRQKYSGS